METGQHILPLLRPGQHIGGHIPDNRLFLQIIADHVGHIGVHGFIVSHTGARSIHNGHIAGPVSIHYSRHPQHGGRIKSKRVQIIVINPAVNHIHLGQSAQPADEYLVVHHHQIPPFHQMDAHLLGQEGMLIIGGVVFAGRQESNDRVFFPGRTKTAQHRQKPVQAMLHIPDGGGQGQLGVQLVHHGAAFEQVRKA
ncbi:hypothetical protein D3C75_508100 [compost metagenome]